MGIDDADEAAAGGDAKRRRSQLQYVERLLLSTPLALAYAYTGALALASTSTPAPLPI